MFENFGDENELCPENLLEILATDENGVLGQEPSPFENFQFLKNYTGSSDVMDLNTVSLNQAAECDWKFDFQENIIKLPKKLSTTQQRIYRVLELLHVLNPSVCYQKKDIAEKLINIKPNTFTMGLNKLIKFEVLTVDSISTRNYKYQFINFEGREEIYKLESPSLKNKRLQPKANVKPDFFITFFTNHPGYLDIYLKYKNDPTSTESQKELEEVKTNFLKMIRSKIKEEEKKVVTAETTVKAKPPKRCLSAETGRAVAQKTEANQSPNSARRNPGPIHIDHSNFFARLNTPETPTKTNNNSPKQ